MNGHNIIEHKHIHTEMKRVGKKQQQENIYIHLRRREKNNTLQHTHTYIPKKRIERKKQLILLTPRE